MKKILLSGMTLCLLGAFNANAQTVIFDEDFTSGIPAGWTQANAGADSDGWITGNAAAVGSQYWPVTDAGSGTIIGSNDDNCNCDKSDDFLMTGSNDLSALTSAYIKWDQFYWAGTYSGATESASLEASVDSGATWTVVEVLTANAAQDVWESRFVDVTAYAGNASVMFGWRYNDGAGWTFGCALDNVSVYEPAANDAELTSLNIAPYVAIGSDIAISGTITNMGANSITSIDVTYTDGVTPVTQTFTPTIASFGTYDFTFTTPLNAPTAGVYNIDVTVALTGDANATNDALSASSSAIAFVPTKRVVLEEATGTWCGWCPRGAEALCTMAQNYPATSIGIAVHNGDPMTIAAYDGGMNVGGYPSGHVDRKVNDTDPSTFEANYLNLINDVPPCDIDLTVTYDGAGALTVECSAEFVADLSGDYRFNVVLTENEVQDDSYSQSNYYGGAGLGLGTCEMDFNTAPATIPGADMIYNHVARAILGGFSGEASSLPATIAAGSTETYTFNTTLDPSWKAAKMHVVAMIIEQSTGNILNAKQTDFAAQTGVEDARASNFSSSVYPNPNKGEFSLRVTNLEADNYVIAVKNVLGQVVYTETKANATSFIQTINMGGADKGVYFVTVSNSVSETTSKVIVE